MIGISTSAWEDIRDRESSLSSGLVLLSDPDLQIISDYGLSHGTLGLELARPASFLIQQDRQVIWRSMPRTWRHRVDAQEVLDLYDVQRVSR